jgi:alpha 1,3-glucosidase
MWMQYPKLPEFYSVDDQYLIGSDLLVKPVTSPGVIKSMIHFPSSESWYDVDTMKRVKSATTQSVAVDSDIDKIPVYQRGGSIIPRKLRLRRSSHLMSIDPYTLFVALGDDLKANGQLYIDDETTFDNEKRQAFGIASFQSSWFDNIAIQNSVYIGNSDMINHTAMRGKIVERIVVVGVPTAPREIRSKYDNSPLEFQYDVSSNIIVIRKPGLSALEDFSLYLIQ